MNIKDAVESFIDLRRSLGHKDQSQTYTLRLFANFLGETRALNSITENDCNAFLYRKGDIVTRYWHSQHCILKKLFEWAFSRGFTQRIPVPVFLPNAPEYYPAHIYTDEELKKIFDGSLTYLKRRPLTNEPACIRYILMTTYVLGLRINETLSLKVKDINAEKMYVHIHCSKFYKSRLVTYNGQVSGLMQEILEWRSTRKYPMTDESNLFINLKGAPVSFVTLHSIFRRIRENAGLYFPSRGRHQPRIHDLRHTFAVNVLTNWYKSGKNVQDLLPKLSTYLGHANISFTSVYLNKTPALLQEANKLFYIYKQDKNEK